MSPVRTLSESCRQGLLNQAFDGCQVAHHLEAARMSTAARGHPRILDQAGSGLISVFSG